MSLVFAAGCGGSSSPQQGPMLSNPQILLTCQTPSECGAILLPSATDSYLFTTFDNPQAFGGGTLQRVALDPNAAGIFQPPAQGGRTLQLAPAVTDQPGGYCRYSFDSAFYGDGATYWTVHVVAMPCTGNDSSRAVTYVLRDGAAGATSSFGIDSIDFDGRFLGAAGPSPAGSELPFVDVTTGQVPLAPSSQSEVCALTDSPHYALAGDGQHVAIECSGAIKGLLDVTDRTIMPISIGLQNVLAIAPDGSAFGLAGGGLVRDPANGSPVDTLAPSIAGHYLDYVNGYVYYTVANGNNVANTGSVWRVKTERGATPEQLASHANITEVCGSVTANSRYVFWAERGAGDGDTTISGDLLGIVYDTLP